LNRTEVWQFPLGARRRLCGTPEAVDDRDVKLTIFDAIGDQKCGFFRGGEIAERKPFMAQHSLVLEKSNEMLSEAKDNGITAGEKSVPGRIRSEGFTTFDLFEN
jgi:hypothetical protein